jgi:hypothetical protein
MDYLYVYETLDGYCVPFTEQTCKKTGINDDEFYFVGYENEPFEQEDGDLLFPIAGS